MSRALVALVGLVACIACAGAGYGTGLSAGKAQQVADANAQTVQQLHSTLDAHVDLVKQSGAASRAMRAALATRQAQDTTSSKELRHALYTTADSRAGCVFPADVMQQLAAARTRAAEAAASGVRSALPTTDTGAGQQPGG